MRPEIKACCEMDVQCLPDLYDVYSEKLDEGDFKLDWRAMIIAGTNKRL